MLSWLEEADLQTSAEASVRRLWPARPPEALDASQVLDLVAASLAASSREAADLVAACNAAYEGPAVADPEWLSDPEVAPLVRHNLRLYYARWLAQYGLYDEVLHHIGDLRPPDVVDPASLEPLRALTRRITPSARLTRTPALLRSPMFVSITWLESPSPPR